MYLPGVDWRLIKAQFYQESLLNPNAESYVGAKGVAQFMPETWKKISSELDIEESPTVAKYSIQAGAYYDAKLKKKWTSPRPHKDRMSLTFASYNAGFGNLVRAQQLCGMPNLYSEIVECLPQVTGHHAKETKTYIKKIWEYWTKQHLGY